jgi:hypothetical protein
MGRLMLMLLVSLLTSGEVLMGKTAGRNVDDTVMTAAVKTKLTTSPAASTRYGE